MVCARISPSGDCSCQTRFTERHCWQASRGGYCTVPQPRHCCSSKRPSAAAAVRPSATRLRAAGGSVGSRVRRTGFLRLGRCKDCRSGTEAPVVVDHAEAAHESQFRVLHRSRSRLAGELTDGLDHAEEAAAGAGLADRKLASRRIERKAAIVGEGVLAYERRTFALLAEAQVLELHERDYGIVVVGLHEVDVAGLALRLRVELVAVERPAGAYLHRVGSEGVVAFDGGFELNARQTEGPGAALREDKKTFGARAGHDAVEEVQRLGDRARR